MDNASFCLACDKKNTCIEICPELEKALPSPTKGRSKFETLVSPRIIDKSRYKSKIRGKHKHPLRYNDNWELSD